MIGSFKSISLTQALLTFHIDECVPIAVLARPQGIMQEYFWEF